MGDGNLVR